MVLGVLAVTMGAATPADASRAELISYSIGSLIVVVTVIRIVVKLFWYILQTLAVLAIVLAAYVLAVHAVHAVQNILSD